MVEESKITPNIPESYTIFFFALGAVSDEQFESYL